MPGATPLLTVFMPVYNAGPYLADAVESILNQSLQNFEFLIINDGSTDNSLEVLEKYAARDKRIRLISRENKGFIKTLEEGFETITTEIVARMDSDDISTPDRLQKQYDFLQRTPDCSVVGCQVRLMSGTGELQGIDPRPTTDTNLKLFLAFGCALSGPTVMFRKRAVENAGGFRQSAWPAEDYDCWARMAAADPKVGFYLLPEVLYHYRLNNEGISLTNKEAQVKQTNKIGAWYRDEMLRRGWQYLTYRTHKGWFDDLSHLDDEDQKHQLRNAYYALQTWFIRDQKAYNGIRARWNKCKLYLLTWLVNRQDMHFIKNQPEEHGMPKAES